MHPSIVRVTRIFHFEAAHALEAYDGACKNIHGHSYKLAVTVRGKVAHQPGNPKDGMVVDFKDLKALVEKEVVSIFDHSLILREGSQFAVQNSSKEEAKILLLPFQPSSENMICYFAEKIKSLLPSHLQLFSLKLSETEKSYAEWFAEDQAR